MNIGVAYRPRTLSGFCGNQKVKSIVLSWFQKDAVPSAILLTGASGLGKTTLGRIIAAMLNCTDLQDGFKPCGKCFGCKQSAIELDCVIDNKKESVEELVQACATRTRTKNRVIILDEVHALTGAAKSVLLKALEEKHPNVYWILATNEPDKLSGTLRSRLTPLTLTLPPQSDFNKLISRVATKAGFELSDEKIEHLYETCGANVRMALNLLHVDAESAGVEADADKDAAVFGLLKALYSFDIADIVRFTHTMNSTYSGMNMIELMVPLRATLDTLLSKTCIPDYRGFITPPAKKFLQVVKKPDVKRLMEVSMALAEGERACTGIALSPSAGRSQFIAATCLYLNSRQ